MIKVGISKNLKKYEAVGMHNQMNVSWRRATDCYIFDKNKKKYLDFTSSIFVANIGHSNSYLKKILSKTINNDLIHTYNYSHSLREKYIKKLVSRTKYFDKAFLLSGGSESVEAVIKLMRLYSINKKKRKPGIIALKGNWHGRTMGAQLLCSDKNQKKWISSSDKNFHFLDFPYPWLLNKRKESGKEFFKKSLKKLKKKINFKKDVCGIVIETFQGWGAIFYPKDYIKAIKKFCNENDILLAFDEMQAGFGRTGKFFGFEHYDVNPDLICCGKGMGSGFPISGVLGKRKILDLAPPGSMSSTNSANPLACASGLATLYELDRKKLIKNSEKVGEFLQLELNNLKKKYKNIVYCTSGKGLIASLIFQDLKIKKNKKITADYLASQICFESAKNGLLLVRTGRESIKIGPPLTIKKKEIKIGIEILEKSILAVLKKI